MSDTITKIDSKKNDYITTKNGEIYKKPSGWAVTGSIMAGIAAGSEWLVVLRMPIKKHINRFNNTQEKC